MNKKGFTLMEMLGVIIILSLLMVLVFPNIVNSVRNSTDKTNKVTEDLVSTALDLYMSDNGYEINSLYFCIPLQQLIDEGYLKKPIKYDDLDDISSVKSVLRFKNNISLVDNDKCLSTILMNYDEDNVFIDPAGNLRFRGKNPNNYVTFNNETWRIIGIVDGHLKLIKDDAIGELQWDNNEKSQWINSSLQNYLNNEYYKNINTTYKDMINLSNWNIGSVSADDRDNATIDKMENLVAKEKLEVFESYIGLLNLSDYGYAADISCKENLYGYNNCSNSNWLFNAKIQWLLNTTLTDVYTIRDDGSVKYNSSPNKYLVRPVVNLKTDVSIESGTGKKNDSYKLEYHKDPVSFETDDWPTIAYNVREGNIDKYTVGATKQVDLGELGVHTLRIANTTTPSECKKEGFSQTACGFVIEFVDIINDQPMNTTNTNVGGWNASSLREYLNDTIYKALTKEIGDIIIDTYVVSGHGLDDNNNQNFTCTDKLYLLSVHEIYEDGSSDKVSTYDTAWNNTRQLDYYIGVTTDDTSGAIKNALWLLRTATSNRTNTFFHGGANGHWDMRYANAPCGVSPAFRIG